MHAVQIVTGMRFTLSQFLPKSQARYENVDTLCIHVLKIKLECVYFLFVLLTTRENAYTKFVNSKATFTKVNILRWETRTTSIAITLYLQIKSWLFGFSSNGAISFILGLMKALHLITNSKEKKVLLHLFRFHTPTLIWVTKSITVSKWMDWIWGSR